MLASLEMRAKTRGGGTDEKKTEAYEGNAVEDDEMMCITFDNTRSYYLLDNGDGLREFKDFDHTLCMDNFTPKHPNFAIACAYGTTEFGDFMSRGYVDKESIPGKTRLTLARRYTKDKDKRLAEIQRSIYDVACVIRSTVEWHYDAMDCTTDDNMESMGQTKVGEMSVPNEAQTPGKIELTSQRNTEYERNQYECHTCGKLPLNAPRAPKRKAGE